ncbi:MAG: tetratricopeptide repeat protein [Polyangiales bacterium]
MFVPLLASCLAMVGGCHHPTLHEGPDLRAELTSVTAEDLFLLGVSHARSGDFLRAEQYLSAARQRGHDEAAVIYWLVRVCVAASRYQSALSHAGDYLRDHPAHWSLRLVVASIYEALGDRARAESELEHIVRAQPERPLPHYRLAMLYRNREDDRGRSKAHLEEYLRLAPQGPHAPEARSVLSEAYETVMGPQLVPFPVEQSSGLEEIP